MIEGLKQYVKCRESGLPWLGGMPTHWRVMRAKSVFHIVDVRSVNGKEELLTVSSARGVVPRPENVTMFKAKSYAGHKLCWPDDLVINSLWAWGGGLGVSRHHGIVSSAYGVYRLRKGAGVLPAFAHQLLRSAAFNRELRVRSKGVWISRLQMSDVAFLDAPIVIPPLEEQAAIVRFLDHVGGRIERAIRAKRKVIALLQEQKQAIIHRAVTRGVDGLECSTATGVQWISHVPEHWQVLPFVRCAIERADYRGATPEKVDAGVFLVTAKNIKQGWIDYTCSREFVRESDYATIMRRGLPRLGDVLLTTEAPLGHVACVDREDVAIAQRVIRFRMAPDRMLPSFALLCLNDRYFQCQLAQRATGSTAQGIKASKLPQLVVAVPPIAEQERTVRYLERETDPLVRGVGIETREIDLLLEFRRRLVADVATGKLDVREAASKLPDETHDGTADSIQDPIDEPIDEEAVVE